MTAYPQFNEKKRKTNYTIYSFPILYTVNFIVNNTNTHYIECNVLLIPTEQLGLIYSQPMTLGGSRWGTCHSAPAKSVVEYYWSKSNQSLRSICLVTCIAGIFITRYTNSTVWRRPGKDENVCLSAGFGRSCFLRVKRDIQGRIYRR